MQHFAKLSSALFTLFFLAACTSNQPPAPTLVLGKPMWAFDFDKATELTMTWNDPQSGQRWNAAARLDPTLPGRPAENWRIQSISTDFPPSDRWANGRLFGQLLDNLATLRPESEAANAPEDRYGLKPPAILLQWVVAGKPYSLELGFTANTPDLRYGRVPELSPKIYLLRGAALKTLEFFRSLQDFRRPELLPFIADDVDQFEIFTFKPSARSVYFAERETVNWHDKKKRALPRAAEILEKWTHARILHYVDSPSERERLTPLFEKSPVLRAVFTHREGPATTLRVIRQSSQTETKFYAQISTREGAVFEVYPEIIRFHE